MVRFTVELFPSELSHHRAWISISRMSCLHLAHAPLAGPDLCLVHVIVWFILIFQEVDIFGEVMNMPGINKVLRKPTANDSYKTNED